MTRSLQGDRPSFDMFMDLSFDLPLHDVQNLAPYDDAMAVGGSDIQGPLRILRHLFHGDEENMPTSSVATLRRQSTELVLDLSFPMAGSSRTASQQRIARDLERMTSIFGSEFDTSDAVFYGGTERSESSFLYHDDEEDQQFAGEDPYDLGPGSRWVTTIPRMASSTPRNSQTRKPFSRASLVRVGPRSLIGKMSPNLTKCESTTSTAHLFPRCNLRPNSVRSINPTEPIAMYTTQPVPMPWSNTSS